MKKFFLLAAAAVMVFASCSKNETKPVMDKGIGFKSYTGRAVTKANEETFVPKDQTWLNEGTSFGVYAYNTKDVAFAGDVANASKFMTNQEVVFNGSSAADAGDYNNYPYEPKKYWPNDEDNNLLTFWAYYPYGALENGFGTVNAFTVEDDPADMVDLLVADVKEDMTYSKAAGQGTVGVVPFTFHHALTMVKFVVVTDDEYDVDITVNEMVLSGVTGSGNLAVSWTADDGTAFEWTPADEVKDFVLAQEANVAVTADDTYFPVNDGNDANIASFLMIPQDLGEATVTITYTVANGDDDPIVNTAEVSIATDAIAEWLMNKNFKYTFKIGLKPIEFTATVTDWEAEDDIHLTVE